MRAFGFCFTLILVSALTLMGQAQEPSATTLTTDQQAALDRISADSLRGHLSFLASDLLEGRDTPSRGLDIAAEYIAAQYRRAGLEPIGDDGYFQTANWELLEPNTESFSLDFRSGSTSIAVSPQRVSFARFDKLEIKDARLIKVDIAPEALAGLQAKDVEGKAVIISGLPDPRKVDSKDRIATLQKQRGILGKFANLKAALVVVADGENATGSGLAPGRLTDPENPRGNMLPRINTLGPPLLTVHDPRVVALLNGLKPDQEASVSVSLGEPVKRAVKVRNVAGLLRGSDPKLKDTYVLVTAHYDHVGIGAPVNGDKIYNGANDDGSGTVSVVEIAGALATLKQRPKRSIVFLTFFGEEKGLLGSRYYGRHPLVPIDATVADVNLEQVGRTDSSEGPQVAAASMTGIDFSDVGTVFEKAGQAEGVKVFKHPRNSDAYFGASDNQALADLGVPAHTLCVAYAYPDYHGALDHWEKVDYANMAKIDRVVARALLSIAENPNPPQWNPTNPKAARYKKAYDARKANAR